MAKHFCSTEQAVKTVRIIKRDYIYMTVLSPKQVHHFPITKYGNETILLWNRSQLYVV